MSGFARAGAPNPAALPEEGKRVLLVCLDLRYGAEADADAFLADLERALLRVASQGHRQAIHGVRVMGVEVRR